jgi:inner membrane protein
MATLGHIAVGMAAARLVDDRDAARQRLAVAMILLALLALAPDLDVIAFALRIPYEAEWGHRGAAHSIGLALLVSLALGAAAWPGQLPPVRTGLAVFVATASHGLLDTLTDGGLGIALFWPLSNARLFAPVQPLPVAPIGPAFLSARGLAVALFELVVFAPVFAVALWPRRRKGRERT